MDRTDIRPHPTGLNLRSPALLAVALSLCLGATSCFAEPAPRPGIDRPAKASTATTVASPRPNPQVPIVLVVGDRFASALADGLDGDVGIVVARTTGDAFGLTRPGFTEALQTIHERLARPDRPALAAMMVGADDRDALADASGRFEPGTPGWTRIYGERVDAVAKLFRDAGVPLVWIGLPIVRSPELSADFVRQNGIVRDHAARDGATYVDSFDAFTDEAGRYSPDGPDLDGTPAKLRRAGGLGFTRAGARKLASFIAPDIARLGRGTAATDVANLTIERARGFDAALDVDVNAQIRREAARSGGETSTAAAAGPILPLTAAPVTKDGQLASLTPPGGAPIGADAIVPQPGRADDFTWPKP